MSHRNDKAKSELKSNLGKRKKGEEQIEDEVESPQRKTHSSTSKPLQGSHKGGKKNASESKSSGPRGDEDMKGVDEEDDDEDLDDEDYDSEDEDEDEEEDDGFIANDEEVEKELERQRKEELRELRKERKLKKLEEKSEKLDDEDLELIQENTGVNVKKRRLKKNIEESEDQDMNDVDQPQREFEKQDSRAKLQMSSARQRREFDEEPEQIDTSIDKRKIQQRPRDINESHIDPDRAAAARQIFADPSELLERVHIAQTQAKEDEEKEALEDIFNGDEIDDQLATKADKLIAERDIPERLQLKLESRIEDSPNIFQDIANEVDWIYHRFIDEQKKQSWLQLEDQVKAKIHNVIKMFRVDHYDIPMITKYRKYEYQKDLDEQDVWTIFNLDIEYGKFQHQLNQMKAFLVKISQIEPRFQEYVQDISKVKKQQKLADYSALIAFLKSYYHEELQQLPDAQRKKVPMKTDPVQQLKKNKLDQCARLIFLDPILFTENLVNNASIHKPPVIQVSINELIEPFLTPVYPDVVKALQGVIKFAALELGVQPYIRAQTKQHLFNIGTLTTTPTERGQKDLDPFHPSFRVKRLTKLPIKRSIEEESFKDLFLDIIQNEKAGLITLEFQFEAEGIGSYLQNLAEKYIPIESSEKVKKIYNELFRSLFTDVLIPEIKKEIYEDLKLHAENFVIKKCQESYRDLLMTGPFSCDKINSDYHDERTSGGRTKKDDEYSNLIPDRPRCTVMGVILQQIDSMNQIATVAVVDKYGELVANKDLQHLMPPRKFTMLNNPGATEEEDQRFKKARLQHQEELKEHNSDKDKITELILKHKVDLIVVGANKLESRLIKQTLTNIAQSLKDFGARDEYEENKKGSKKRESNMDEVTKEAFVIWGSLEVAKLFANSHQSRKLLKDCHPILKQAVSLARYQQDPMNEILNLWSFTPSENQALQIFLHPLQKHLTQAKLSDALEEVNVQCVNAVGVDLNLVMDHDHMHILLSFISGLGPRKAKNLIQDLKSKQKRIYQRGQLYGSHFQKCVYASTTAFLKIRIPPEERSKDQHQALDIMDQTRIHQESYAFAYKIGRDLIYDGKEVDAYHSQLAIKEIIKNPSKLRDLDIKQYSSELEKSGQENMIVLVEYILSELTNPFKDPRVYRTPTNLDITNNKLFYLLIDESERSFKKGMIVTATVTKVLDNLVFCKLDNGLDAMIQKNDLEKTTDKLQDIIKVGHVISGRIHEIKNQDETKFGVALNCKKKDLESHEQYVDRNEVSKEDMTNYAFKTDTKASTGARFIPRRIAHPKFKNLTSQKAVNELANQDVGEFLFRPSPQGENNITLTWKFYNNNIVHINIEEREKAIGASIGSKLLIGDEIFENLQEIIERYIMPCNRNTREATNHMKFRHCDTQDELENALKEEKQSDPNKIPYKLTILPQYPQHLVLGYMPRETLKKTYIKVKPRGFWFVEKYHMTPQAMIDYFKNNFRDRDFERRIRRQISPRAKAPQQQDPNQMNEERGRGSSQQQTGDDWGNVGNDWKRPGSVHMNDDQPMEDVSEQRTHFGQRDQDFGGNRSYGRGQQSSSIQPSYGRGGRGRGQPREEGGYGRDQIYGSSFQKQEDPQPTWSNTATGNSPAYNNDNAWGQSNSQGAFRQPDTNTAGGEGGWGSKTPQRTDFGNSGWNAADNSGFNYDDRGNSPPRSMRSGDEGGRGRGRGRGEGRGGLMQCFKCQQEGHMARDCPNPDQRQGGRGRGGSCFKCGEEGHFSRECPNQARGDDGDRGRGRGRGRGGGGGVCFKCNQEGHFARECPNEQSEGRPYKRQRRDDGGSARREDEGGNNNDWNNNGDNYGNSGGNQEQSNWGAVTETGNNNQSSTWGNGGNTSGWGS